MNTKRYTVIVSGYEPLRESWTLKEAQTWLAQFLKDELADVKRRYRHARPKIHRCGNTGRVTMGRDVNSTLWLSAAIIPAS